MDIKDQLKPVYDKVASLTGNFYKTIFLICSALALIALPIMSQQSGMTDDERLHEEHGQRIFNYYIHGDTLAATTPFTPEGEWRIKNEPTNYVALLNIYGGFFDYVATFVYRTITHHFMGLYESKHMLSALTGWGLLVLIGFLTFRLTGSWAAGLIGFLLAAGSPRIIGHSLCNPKDIPFALGFGLGLYQILRALQEDLRLPWWRVLLLIVTFIIAIDTRVGGVILMIFLVMFAGLYILDKVILEKQSLWSYKKQVALIIGICIVSYFGCSLFWPFAGKNPLLNPIRCLNVFSAFSDFNSYELFEGVRINATEIPWYFAPKWFYITFPPVVIIGVLAFPVFLWRLFSQSRANVITYGLIIFSIVFPLLSVILKHSNLYDDVRHLYFLLPSLIALSAVAWYSILKVINDNKVFYSALVLLALMMFEPFAFMARNHPVEAMYFSPFIGGPKGAFKNYEMDYWGFSLRPGLNWIEATDSIQAHGRKTRVRMWYGEQQKVKYYCAKSNHLEYKLTDRDFADWDYTLVLPAESKRAPELLINWPPPGTIHEVMADGAPLCAIVRNPKSDFGNEPSSSSSQESAAPADPDLNKHLGIGVQLYNNKEYNKAVIEFKIALQIDSTSQMAWNDLIASYNNLHMFGDAVQLAEKAVKKFPDYALLKNNRVMAKDGQSKLKIDENYLIEISYNYFVQQDFPNCARASEMLLKLNPKSSTACNNLCSAYNSMGNFKLGKEYCEKGLKLAPQHQLLQNNLKVAKKGLGERF